jgi:hypothetical protein
LLGFRNLDPRCSNEGLLYRAKYLILKASSFKSWGTLPNRCSRTDSTANEHTSTKAVNAACVITQKYVENKLSPEDDL